MNSPEGVGYIFGIRAIIIELQIKNYRLKITKHYCIEIVLLMHNINYDKKLTDFYVQANILVTNDAFYCCDCLNSFFSAIEGRLIPTLSSDPKSVC